jgi:hypothetical protein
MNCPNCNHEIDLHEHDAEVRKPLVDALELAASYVHKQYDNPKYTVSIYGSHLKQIDDALAKIKQ